MITKQITPEELSLPLWYAEISVEEIPFPFAMKIHAFTKESAFGKVEYRARQAKLTPTLRLEAHTI